jgi:hypothetical protein
MAEQKLIGLIDAVKKSRDSLRNNQNLGYLVKTAMITSVAVSIAMILWSVIYTTVFATAMSKLTNYSVTGTTKESTTYKPRTSNYVLGDSTAASPFDSADFGTLDETSMPAFDDSTDFDSTSTQPSNYADTTVGNSSPNPFMDTSTTNDMVDPYTSPYANTKSPAVSNYNYGRNTVPLPQNAMPASFDTGPLVALGGIFIVAFIVFTLYSIFMAALSLKTALDIAGNTPENIKELIKGTFKLLPKFVVLTSLRTALVMIGYAFFVIPGSILSLMFMFADIILVKEHTGIVDALKQSKELVKGYKKDLFLKVLGLFFVNMFIVMPIMWALFYPMGILFSIVYMVLIRLVLINFYEDLKRIKSFGFTSTEPIPMVNTATESLPIHKY